MNRSGRGDEQRVSGCLPIGGRRGFCGDGDDRHLPTGRFSSIDCPERVGRVQQVGRVWITRHGFGEMGGKIGMPKGRE
jgi:hypothetical protein